MNEDLSERFGRRNDAYRKAQPSAGREQKLGMKVNHSIRQYFKDSGQRPQNESPHWANSPEIPLPNEIWHPAEEEQEDEVELQENIVVGPYPSKDEYLECHYKLLREDAGKLPSQEHPSWAFAENVQWPRCEMQSEKSSSSLHSRRAIPTMMPVYMRR